MGQVSAYLRRIEGGYSHWCPGCLSMHIIPTDEPFPSGARWSFDGNVERPTFNPSVRITYNGLDADQPRDGDCRTSSGCCHYFLHAGELRFCGDCTHDLNGKTVALPELPSKMKD